MAVPDLQLEGCWDFDASPGGRALSFQDGRGGDYPPLTSARGGKHAPWCRVMDDGGVDLTANEGLPNSHTLNPKPSTPYPKPHTLNPEP